MASKLSTFFHESKRRKVYPVVVTYVGVAAVTVGLAADALGQVWERLPLLVLVLFLIGFPVALVLAWTYEVKPEEPREVEAGPTLDTAESERKSIVVLPFDNMSPDSGDAYFSDGLTEEIITNLSHLHSLRVISRSSAMVLKGTQKDVRTIGKELDVQYVLEGSVRKVGDELRITAQLIDAKNDEHLWAEKFDGEIGDVFSIQEEFARSIVDALRLRLSPEEDRRLAENSRQDPQAYECYLRARHEAFRFSDEGLNRARRILENGIEIMGSSELLHAALGEVHYHFVDMGLAPDREESLRIAERHAKNALALNENSALGRRLSGLIGRARGDLSSFLRHFQAARALEESDSYTLWMLAFGLSAYAGKTELSRPLAQQAVQFDPLEPWAWTAMAVTEWMSGDLEEALSLINHAVRLDPDVSGLRFWRGHLLARSERKPEALEEFEGLLEGDLSGILSILSQLAFHALRGNRVDAMEILEGDSGTYVLDDPEGPWFAAGYSALLGEEKKALDLLDRAVEIGWHNYPLFNEIDPLLEGLMGSERYRRLLGEVKKRWEEFEF